jgi:hypothetical protein
LLLVCSAGCANQVAANLTVSCVKSGQTFSQCFPEAYSTLGKDGNADVVLVNGSDTAVSEVMHIRVLWRPTRDLKSDHDSAQNATVHWYVMGKSPADIIEYDGTAMVVVEPGEHGATLSIRSATLRPVARRGSLRDPLGVTALYGSVRTSESADRVHKILSDLRASVAAARNAPGNLTLRTHAESPSSLAQ